MKQKITSVVLALVMILSLMPYALADDSGEVTTRNGTITWSISGDTLTISGTGVIPDEFSFDYLDDGTIRNIVNLKVESGITSIGAYAFEMLEYLETAKLAASVENIGDSAFAYLQQLYEVAMPGVKTIGDSAFYNTKLNEEDAPLPETLMVIGKSAFLRTRYNEFELSANVSSIAENALSSQQLSYITVSEENPMFSAENGILFDKDKTALICYPARCRLKKWDRQTTPEYEPDTYTIPSTVKRIYGYALNKAEYLGKVIIPASVEEIGIYAFNQQVLSEIDASANESFEYENGVLYDSEQTMVYMGLKQSVPEKLVIADGVKYIENSAFLGCAIMELVLPESLETIGRFAFAECDALGKVTMHSGVREIKYHAFSWDEAITEIQFNGTKSEWNRLKETAEDGNTTLFDAQVTYSDPDGIDAPIFYSLEYHPAAKAWYAEFYAGTITENCTAIVAMYDSVNGSLLGVRTVNLTPESVMEYASFGNISEQAEVRAVVYCWNSVGGMKPIWNTPLMSKIEE